MVVAAGVVRFFRPADFAHRCSAELAAPDDQRFVEHTSLLQVLDQRSGRLIGCVAVLLGELLVDFAVVVPTCMHQQDEADASLHQPSRQQTVGGVRAGLFLVHAVHVERRGRLLAEIEQFGSRGLHSKCKLVGVNPGSDFGIPGLLLMVLIEIADRIKARALALWTDAGRIRKVEDRVAGIAKHRSGID